LLERKRSRSKYDHWALGLTNRSHPSLSSLRSPVQNSVFASSCVGATRGAPAYSKRKRSRSKYEHWALGLTNRSHPSLSSLRSPVQNSVFASSCVGATRGARLTQKESDQGSKYGHWALGLTNRSRPSLSSLRSPVQNSVFATSCDQTISISRRCSIESATACTTFIYSSPCLNPGWGEIPLGDLTAAMKSASTFQLCSSCGGIDS